MTWLPLLYFFIMLQSQLAPSFTSVFKWMYIYLIQMFLQNHCRTWYLTEWLVHAWHCGFTSLSLSHFIILTINLEHNCMKQPVLLVYFSRYVFDGHGVILQNRCVICQMKYKRGDRQMKLPCRHVYHSECITKWLGINKVTGLALKHNYILWCLHQVTNLKHSVPDMSNLQQRGIWRRIKALMHQFKTRCSFSFSLFPFLSICTHRASQGPWSYPAHTLFSRKEKESPLISLL